MKLRPDVFGYGGLALLALAGIVRLAVIDSGPVALGIAAAAGILLLVYFLRAEHSVDHFLSRRSTRAGGNVFATTLFLFGIAVLVNLLASRTGFRVDVTEDRIFTLAPETRRALAAAPVPPEVWVFQPEGSAAATYLQGLLDAVREEDPRIRIHVVDPARDPVLAARFELRTYGTVVQVGDRQEVFEGVDEENFLAALLRASRPGLPWVGFLEGHGERSFAGPNPEEYRRASEALSRRGFRVSGLDLLRGDRVDSLDLVVLAGPRTALTAPELDSLAAYLDRGGRMLALLDPDGAPDLEAVLAPYSIRFIPEFLVDPAGRDPAVLYPADYAPHPVMKALEERRIQVVFPGAGEVTVPRVQDAIDSTPLLRSGRGTRVAERSDSEPRPRTLGAAVRRPAASGGSTRIVVFGDVDFASNRMFDILGNGDLFMSSVQWLVERESLIELRPRPVTNRPVIVTRQQGRALMVVVVGLLPLGVILAGFLVWWRRR